MTPFNEKKKTLFLHDFYVMRPLFWLSPIEKKNNNNNEVFHRWCVLALFLPFEPPEPRYQGRIAAPIVSNMQVNSCYVALLVFANVQQFIRIQMLSFSLVRYDLSLEDNDNQRLISLNLYTLKQWRPVIDVIFYSLCKKQKLCKCRTFYTQVKIDLDSKQIKRQGEPIKWANKLRANKLRQ